MILIGKATKLNPEIREWQLPLAAAYAHMDKDQEARESLEKFGYLGLRKDLWYHWPFKDQEVAKRFESGLRKAGMN